MRVRAARRDDFEAVTRLLEEAQRRARERGCHAIAAESGYRRAEAHHLYRTFRMRDEGKFFRKQLRVSGVSGRSPR